MIAARSLRVKPAIIFGELRSLEQTKRGNTLAGGSRAGVCTTECVHPVEHLRVEVRASRKGHDLITRGADQPQ